MARSLRMLAIALGALFAASAMVTGSANAAESAALTLQETEKAGVYKTYEGEKGALVVKQTETVKFTRGTDAIECKEFKFEVQKISDGVTSITTKTPVFNECTGPIGLEAKVEMSGCHFHFDFLGEENKEEEGGDTFTALSSLLCEEEAHATINVFNEAKEVVCQYSLPEKGNQGLSGIDLTNKGAGGQTPEDWVKADVQVEGITSERTIGPAFLCGPAEHNGGVIEGDWEIKAAEEGTAKLLGVTISTH